jgi:hypothetical protein
MFSKLDYEIEIKMKREKVLDLLDQITEDFLKFYDTLKIDLPLESNREFWIKAQNDFIERSLSNSGWELKDLLS